MREETEQTFNDEKLLALDPKTIKMLIDFSCLDSASI